MTEKIWLLDSNPLKIKHNNNWLKKVKTQRTFHDINEQYLMMGLYEMQKNIALFEREDTYTLGENIQEFEQLEEIVYNSLDKFEQRCKRYGKQGTRGKTNRELYHELANKIQQLKEQMKKSIYNPRLDKGYISIINLVTRSSSNGVKLKKYSQADIMLATTAIIRANNEKETYILTPDRDISRIIRGALLRIDENNLNGFKMPTEIENRINIFNTYNDKLTKDEILYFS